MRGLAALTAVALCACVEGNVVVCEDGRRCPSNQVCDEIHDTCVLPDQLVICEALAENDPCEIAGSLTGRCRDGVCVREGCYDGIRTGTEECDRDDLGDVADCTDLGFYEPGPVGCTGDCRFDVRDCERRCGDVTLDAEEQCDVTADVVLADCTDFGFYGGGDVGCTRACTYDVSGCAGRCGDGVVDPAESCDETTPTGTCLEFGYDAGRLGCSPFCTPGFDSCQRIGWHQLVPPTEQAWHGLWAIGAVTFVVGDGAILRIDAGGATTSTAVSGSMRAVWGSSATDVHAVGTGGAIWHHDGATWSQTQGVPPGGDLLGIWGAAADDVYAVGAGGRILHHDGTGWTEVHSGGPALWGVWGADAGVVRAVGDGGTVLWLDVDTWRTENIGITNNLRSISGAATGDVFVVGAGGAIRHFDGQAWAASPSGTLVDLREVWSRGAGDVYAAGADGTILHHDGAGWWRLSTTTGANLNAIGGTVDAVHAVGEFGTIVQRGVGAWAVTSAVATTDVWSGGPGLRFAVSNQAVLQRVGATWTNVFSFVEAPIVGFCGTAANNLFAIEGGNGYLRRWDGAQWGLHGLGGALNPRDAWCLQPDAVYVVGDYTIVRWTGATWVSDGGDLAYYRAIGGTSPTDLFAVGIDADDPGGASFISHRDAVGWSSMANPGIGFLNDVYAAAPDDVYAVGVAGMVLHYDGVAWTAVDAGAVVQLEAVDGTGPDDVFAIGRVGTILHWDGVAWSRVRSPVQSDLVELDVDERSIWIGTADGQVLTLFRDGAW